MIEDRIIIANKFKYYNDRLADYDKQIAKVSELEKLVVSMRQEMDTLKTETQHSKYLVYINYNNSCWRNWCVDTRYIQHISVSHNNGLFIVTIDTIESGRIQTQISSRDRYFPWDGDDIKRKKYLDFFNTLTEHKGVISSCGINIFDYIGKCTKIKKLIITDCNEVVDMSQILNFPELDELEIMRSSKIHNIKILEQHKSLKKLVIDSVSQKTDCPSGTEFIIQRV